jgi:hypothetical protein
VGRYSAAAIERRLPLEPQCAREAGAGGDRRYGDGRYVPDRERMAWADWLRSMRWDAWATPTFEEPVSRRAALRALRRWLRKLGRRTYAAAVIERGRVGGLVHCHALIGVVGRGPLRLTTVGALWRHGNVRVERYDVRLDRPGTRGGASWYLTKTGTDAVELIGDVQVYRARRRGGRGR